MDWKLFGLLSVIFVLGYVFPAFLGALVGFNFNSFWVSSFATSFFIGAGHLYVYLSSLERERNEIAQICEDDVITELPDVA